MDFSISEDQRAIRDGVGAVVRRFDDDYWLARDDDGEFPHAFHRAMAEAGWLGITMPAEHGGAGLGVTEAAIMMHEVASHGGGMAAASTVHINLFGPHPIVVFGTPEQRQRWLPRLVEGKDQCAFGFTEPDAGLNTSAIKTFAQKVPGGYLVHGQKVWTSMASRSSTPTSTAARSRCGALQRWGARRSIPTRSSSTACSSPNQTASATKEKASPPSCTA